MRVVCSSEMIDKITVYDYIPYGKEPNHRLYIRKDKEYQLVKEYYFTKNPIIIENGEYVIKGYSSNEEEVIYSNTDLKHVICFANNITAKIWQIHALAICQHKEPFKSINCKTT